MNRRDFIKRCAGITIGGATTLNVAGPFGLVYSIMIYNGIQDIGNDYKIVNKETEKLIEMEKHVKDVKINNKDFKLFSVSHGQKFIENNFNTIDDMVKKFKKVVIELNPFDQEDMFISKEGKTYFNSVIKLCEKYSKPIVYLDSANLIGSVGDILFSFGGAFYP